MSGLFITMEGTDGAGKTTQLSLLKDYLNKKGFNVVLVREPGGTNIGEKIRSIILDIENKEMNCMTEALLYASSRAQLVNQVIVPELKNGSVVICDRFVDSSIVYQGIARNIGMDIVKKINNIATGGLIPDITFFLDLPPNKAIERKKEQKELDRLESEKDYFYKKVYEGYKILIDKNSERIKVIDALQTIDEIHKNIINHLEKIFF
ncbi:dTMP kinase [uncultured Tyzzerella sp.]|uniref:dTMP kinase n=1 Tax=uncultured Tyzzerella sp. TaxID=2321398 RepID=UPI002943B8D6|nr:dTMP kinase [uncultured Tyzzerella sp.]